MHATQSDRKFTDHMERRLIQKELDDFWLEGGNFADLLALHHKRGWIRRELDRVSRADKWETDDLILPVAFLVLLLATILLAAVIG